MDVITASNSKFGPSSGEKNFQNPETLLHSIIRHAIGAFTSPSYGARYCDTACSDLTQLGRREGRLQLHFLSNGQCDHCISLSESEDFYFFRMLAQPEVDLITTLKFYPIWEGYASS